MAVTTTWALLAAHMQGTRNRHLGDLGAMDRLTLLIAIPLMALFLVLPLVLGSLVVGFFVGRELPDATHIRVLGGMLAYLVLVGCAVGGDRALDWERTRIFPLRPMSLFTAELVAGLGDLLPLSFAVIAGCLLMGVGLAQPRLLPLLPLPWLGTIGALLGFRLLIANLVARATRHLKTVLAVVTILVLTGYVLISEGVVSLERPGAERILKVVDALPSTQCIAGMGAALDGDWLTAAMRQIYPALALLFLLFCTATTLRMESSSPNRAGAASALKGRLWSFTSPARGVARLHLVSLMKSSAGKVGLIMPLLVLIFLVGPMALPARLAFLAVPVALSWVAFLAAGMQMNQFGLDGTGIKTLLLLPIRSRDLLAGKALALSAFLGLQVLSVLGILGLMGRLRAVEAMAGLCLAGGQFFFQVGVGHWTSTWVPNPIPRDVLTKTARAARPSWRLAAVLLGTSALGTAVFGGTYVLAAWLNPSMLLPMMAYFILLAALAYRLVVLPLTARYMERRKEVLVQALG